MFHYEMNILNVNIFSTLLYFKYIYCKLLRKKCIQLIL